MKCRNLCDNDCITETSFHIHALSLASDWLTLSDYRFYWLANLSSRYEFENPSEFRTLRVGKST